jgi:uncharacterized cupin superfamily protein
MFSQPKPPTILAIDIPPRAKKSNYPEPFATMVSGRIKRQLGDFFGLRNFGVNLTSLPPGSISALRHSHTKQDEFVYVLEGFLILETDDGPVNLSPGMCAGFPAGTGKAHQLRNASDDVATYLEIGDRSPGDEASYPDDDLVARNLDGQWVFFHKNGEPY